MTCMRTSRIFSGCKSFRMIRPAAHTEKSSYCVHTSVRYCYYMYIVPMYCVSARPMAMHVSSTASQ